eukprot:CAMPEP_0172183886 /NCGR_PEP_ID=MMETSP1050-20130122/19254_1 /TAXON_ID=233186 /ORGANISM="Cryptomonas curvata, Strain CCAP979/52" /LENGTH=67 /DNA_ID=CAMNT_0012857593 /DNA_START=104 /DNA_END=307 /DNA_ORIENTATION=+
MGFEDAKIASYEASAQMKAARDSMRFHQQAMMAQAPTCASRGIFGCGGRDFSSSYKGIHEGNPVVFM